MIIGISGASGVIYGIRLLSVLRELPDVETHLIVSRAGAITIGLETEYTLEQVTALADVTYREQDIAARISSGSFRTDGMISDPMFDEDAGRNCPIV